jgi:hypothetical protein
MFTIITGDIFDLLNNIKYISEINDQNTERSTNLTAVTSSLPHKSVQDGVAAIAGGDPDFAATGFDTADNTVSS